MILPRTISTRTYLNTPVLPREGDVFIPVTSVNVVPEYTARHSGLSVVAKVNQKTLALTEIVDREGEVHYAGMCLLIKRKRKLHNAKVDKMGVYMNFNTTPKKGDLVHNGTILKGSLISPINIGIVLEANPEAPLVFFNNKCAEYLQAFEIIDRVQRVFSKSMYLLYRESEMVELHPRNTPKSIHYTRLYSTGERPEIGDIVNTFEDNTPREVIRIFDDGRLKLHGKVEHHEPSVLRKMGVNYVE